MLYQPGLNESNSCWLPGKWLYVSKEEYEKRHKSQNDMYSDLRKKTKDQHHRDGSIDPSDMDKAQKQAWEFFSGTSVFDCLVNEKYHSAVGVHMKANRTIWDSDIKWMREKKFKFIKYILHNNEAVEQMKGIDVPEDLIIDKKKPVNTLKMTVNQNKEKSRQMFRALSEPIEKQKNSGLTPSSNDFYTLMAVRSLIELETEIIRNEWHKKYNKEMLYDTYEDDIKDYVEQRAKLKELLKDKFEPIYNDIKESANSCNRTNRDNGLYSYVLPTFYDNGTHEPWTENDVPDPKEK